MLQGCLANADIDAEENRLKISELESKRWPHPLNLGVSRLTLNSAAQDASIGANEIELDARKTECRLLQETVSTDKRHFRSARLTRCRQIISSDSPN